MAAEKEVSFVVKIKDAGSAALKEIEKAAEKSVEKLFSFKEILSGIVGAVGAFSLAEVIKDITELGIATDKTFRQIAANLPTFTEGISELRENLDHLAESTGRNLEEVRSVAGEISKLGVKSAEDLALQTSAAIRLSDATGVSASVTAQVLQQLRREFDLTGEAAEEVAAKLATAARGRVNIEELLGALGRAAPIFQGLGATADEGTKAIIALVEAGHTARAIGTDLKGLDLQGLRDLAATVKDTGDALEDYQARVAHVEEGTERTLERWKTAWKEALESAWDSVKTNSVGILTGLQALKDGFDGLIPLARWQAMLNADGKTPSWIQSLTHTPPPQEEPNDLVSGGDLGAANDETNEAKRVAAILAASKARQEAAKQADALGKQLDSLAQKEESGGLASVRFASQIAEWQKEMTASGKSTAEISVKLAEYNKALGQMRTEEASAALKKQQQAAKDAADAWRKLDDAFSKLSGSKITEFDQQFADLFLTLQEGAAKITDPDQLLAYLGYIDELKTKYGELRVKVVDADGVQKLLNADLDGLAALKPGLDAMVKDLADQAQAEKDIRQLAQAWDTVGRSVIAAAQAVGGLDSATAAALQNMVTLGAGVLKLFSGDIAGGLAESVSSLAALGKGLFGGDNAASKAQAKVIEDNSAALRHLSETLKGVNQPGSSLDTAFKTVIGLTGRPSAAGSLYQYGGAGVKADMSGLTPDQLDAISAAAKLLNITLDGTEASIVALMVGISKGRPEIEKTYQAQQKQMQEDYHIRLLRAEGFTTEANADELAAQQARELQKARDDVASADTIAALQAAQYAEAQKAAADIARQATQAQEDLHVRLLRASGNTDAADAEAFREGQQREYEQAVRDGADAATLAALKQTQLAEATAFAADQAERAAQAMYQAAEASFNQADDVYGTGGPDKATERASQYGFDLSTFDLKTKAGVDGAISYLQGLYAAADQTTKDEIQSVIHALRGIQIPDSAAASGSGASASGSQSASALGYQSLTYIQGERLSDIGAQQLRKLTSIDDRLESWGSGSVARPSMGSVYPVGGGITGAAGGSLASLSGAVTINVGSIQVRTNGDDPNVQGAAMADAFIREIDVKLGRTTLMTKVYRGDISVSPR